MSAFPRYAPEFAVEIDDAAVPAALRASIASVRYDTGLEGADRVELTIVNENLRWLDHDLLKLDRKLALSLGYAGRGEALPVEQVFVGEVVTHGASFPSSGVPVVTVAALDRRQRLREGTKSRWFGIPTPIDPIPLPDLPVAGIVSLENGMLPFFDPIGAAISVLLSGAEIGAAALQAGGMQKLVRKQLGESDYKFLHRLAKENGWEMVVDHAGELGGHVLRFMSPLDHLEEDVTLRYGQSLIEFNPKYTKVGQILAVTAFVWVAPIKMSFAVTVGFDWDRVSLTLDIRPALALLGAGKSDVIIQEPVTPATAPRKLLGQLIPKLNKRVRGTGLTIGDPRIRAGAVLRLEGLGLQYGGLWRVTSATHTVDSQGYRTKFEVRKEVWFGLIPPVQQGAGPIRARVPFVA